MWLTLGVAFMAPPSYAQDSDISSATVLHTYIGYSDAASSGTATRDQLTDAAIALGYIGGVADTIDSTVACIPAHVTRAQELAIVVKYLNDHPDQWQIGSSVIIERALKASFPCPAK
jgi:hypothetical protein